MAKLKTNRIKIGSKVTINKGEKEAYYSNYGFRKDSKGNFTPRPKVIFRAGMIGTVVNNDVPVVRGKEGAWFYLVEFNNEVTGEKELVNLYHHEIIQI